MVITCKDINTHIYLYRYKDEIIIIALCRPSLMYYIAKDAASGTQRSEIVSSTRVLYEP